MPFEPMLQGSIWVCTECAQGDGSMSPLWPGPYRHRHEAWHAGQARNGPEFPWAPPDDPGHGEGEPVLERAS